MRADDRGAMKDGDVLIVPRKALRRHGEAVLRASAKKHLGVDVVIDTVGAPTRRDMRLGVCPKCGRRGLLSSATKRCTGSTSNDKGEAVKFRSDRCVTIQERNTARAAAGKKFRCGKVRVNKTWIAKPKKKVSK